MLFDFKTGKYSDYYTEQKNSRFLGAKLQLRFGIPKAFNRNRNYQHKF